jgi:L-rhamnose-H+ transport protein
MQDRFLLGLLVGVLAGLMNGVFLLPMRYTRNWAWENTWLVFTILSTGILPWVAALVGVPNLMVVLRETPVRYLLPGLVAGGVWGIAQVLYGLGLGMVGIAIGSAVVACTSTMAGTLGPMLVYADGQVSGETVFYFLLAVVVILGGIYMYGRSGVQKERETASKGKPLQVVAGSFRTGLVICLTTGVLGTAFIYGAKSSSGLVGEALAAGAPSRLTAEFVSLLVTFNAGMVPGVIYSIYRLGKKGTWSAFRDTRVLLWNLSSALVMAVLWYSGILMYNSSGVMLGFALGPSISFALFAGGTVLFASLFGWMAGEWKGASAKTVQGFVIGMSLIVLAILVIAFKVRF